MMSMAQAGGYISAFFIGYLVTQIPAGVLADRFGVRLLLTGSMVINGSVTVLMSFIQSYDHGFVLRVILGLAAGAVFASCTRALMEWFPAHERGTAFGMLMASPSTGLLLANAVVPPLNSALAWRGTFMTVGLLVAAYGVIVYLLMRVHASSLPQQSASPLAGVSEVLLNPYIILTAFGGFALLWLQTNVATWANAYMNGLGFDLATASQVVMLYSVGGILGPLVSGLISDRYPKRATIVMAALLFVAPAAILFSLQTSFASLALAAFAMGFIGFLANPQQVVLISEFAGKDLAATANGIGNFATQLASVAGPFTVGLMVDLTGSFSASWWVIAAGPLVGALLMLPVKRKAEG